MRESVGFIKDYRQELDSDIWLMPPLYHRVWQYLKYKVNYYENEIPMKDGTKMQIRKGQHLTSVRSIAKGIGWYEGVRWQEPNPKTIATILEWLEKQEMITIDRGKGNKQYTLITILNWKTFQEKSFWGNTPENGEGNPQEAPSIPYGSKDFRDYLTDEGNSQGSNTSVTPINVDITGFYEGESSLGVTPHGEGPKHLADIKKEVKESNKNENKDIYTSFLPNMDQDDFKHPSGIDVNFLPLINQLKIKCKGLYQHDELKAYLGLMEEELIREALKRSEKKSVAYAMEILENWKDDDIHTITELRQKQKSSRRSNSFKSPTKLPEAFREQSDNIHTVHHDPNDDLEYQELLKQTKSLGGV